MISKDSIIVKLLIKHIKSIPKLFKSFNFSHKQQKYTLTEYLIEILYVLKTGIAWRDIRSKINWNSIYKAYIKLNKYKIFEISYVYLLNKYLKRGINNKLKYVTTDTTFIPNKRGKDLIGFNKYYNKKKGTKISIITDSKGIPFNIAFYKGNKNDGRIFLDQIKKQKLTILDKNKSNTRLFMADPAYDIVNFYHVKNSQKEIRLKIKDMNYDPLIAQNKRAIKDPNKIIVFNDTYNELYKKRLVVERTFNRMKNDRKICLRYESKIENFIGFVYLSLIKLLC
jgi:transposase